MEACYAWGSNWPHNFDGQNPAKIEFKLCMYPSWRNLVAFVLTIEIMQLFLWPRAMCQVGFSIDFNALVPRPLVVVIKRMTPCAIPTPKQNNNLDTT